MSDGEAVFLTWPISTGRLHYRILCVAAAMAVLVGCDAGRPHDASEMVIVLAAASTEDALEEIAGLFEQHHSAIEIKLCTGSTNGLARQILAGASADLFLSANKKWADTVAAQRVDAETVELLANRLVLIVPKGNPAGVQNLAGLGSPDIEHVALAGENVPAGIYADQALRALGLLKPLRDANKLARGSDVRAALAYVARGEAEAGIVYATDARATDRVEVVIELDRNSYDRVTYPAMLFTASTNREAAQRFFLFLRSKEARIVFQRHGFTCLEQ